MKLIDNLKWSPNWVSHLGCLKGCLDYLGIQITDAWLYGGTGHAFIINIGKDCCPSGPTAWKTFMRFEQGPVLGCQIDGVFGSKYNQSLEELQEQAWSFTKKSLESGFPVFAWELEIPEFYVIDGYDEDGYYFSGPGVDEGSGPKSWQELGDTEIGMVKFNNLKPVEPKTAKEVVKSALEKSIKHVDNPEKWIFENYAAGLKGFDNWISGLENGVANRFGLGYNAAVWHECRHFAAEFLVEARDRFGAETYHLFDQAARHYQVVVDNLAALSDR
jgi:hypothetical protein